MGVIQRQGIKESIVAYVGMIIGAVSILYVRPNFLTPAEIGLIATLISAATLLMPFVQLGMTATAIKYFPYFEDKEAHHNSFLWILLGVPILGCIIISILFLLLYPFIEAHYITKSSLIVPFLYYILPLAFIIAYFTVFMAFCRSLFRIVVPSFFQNIVLKGGLIIIILLYAFQWISLKQLVWSILVLYTFMLVGLIVYVYALGHLFLKPNFKKFTKPLLKEMGTYAFYVFLAGFAGILVLQIDVLMLSALKNDASVGIYTIALYIGTVIEIPRRSLNNISAPVVAAAWKDNDTAKIADLYQRTSILQFIVGLYLLTCIWASIDDLFLLIPNGDVYSAGKYVVLFIGLAKVVDMLTSINNEIIINSAYYRFNFYAMPLLAVLTILTNLLFIPKWGIVGAAIASLAALTLFNIAKLVFIYWKMDMQPFSLATIKVLLITILSFVISLFLPLTENAFINIILRSTFISIVMISAIILTKVSPDFNNFLQKMLQKIKLK